MNFLTHRIIAKKVYECLKEDMGIVLVEKKLIWGSVRPDFVKNHVPHYMDESKFYFYQLLDEAITIDPLQDVESFSEKLGEIFHFLCDYFCSAHILEELKNDFFKHFLYENHLHQYAKKLRNKFFLNSFSYTDEDLNYKDLCEIMEEKYKLFLNNPLTPASDLNSAYNMCIISAKKLLKTRFTEEDSKIYYLFNKKRAW